MVARPPGSMPLDFLTGAITVVISLAIWPAFSALYLIGWAARQPVASPPASYTKRAPLLRAKIFPTTAGTKPHVRDKIQVAYLG
jgi:hypothetical protein